MTSPIFTINQPYGICAACWPARKQILGDALMVVYCEHERNGAYLSILNGVPVNDWRTLLGCRKKRFEQFLEQGFEDMTRKIKRHLKRGEKKDLN